MSKTSQKTPWFFVPSLYFAEGIPYCVVMILSVVMFKKMSITNREIGIWTSLLSLPWVIKPLWSPLVEMHWKKRRWIWIMQLLIGSVFAIVAPSLHLPSFFPVVVCLLGITAMLSATHDIAADGFYILSLNSHQQALFAGIRNTFYRLAMIFCQGGLIMAAGMLESSFHHITYSWTVIFFGIALLMLLLGTWHWCILPHPDNDKVQEMMPLSMWSEVFSSFFRKPGIARMLFFLLVYRLGEGQLVKMMIPFMLDARAAGGLALSTTQVGFIYGMIGTISLLAGGIIGGLWTASHGLKKTLPLMWACMNIPDILYLGLSYYPPGNQYIVWTCVCAEQFGYGVGFVGYMLYMLYIAGQGKWKTAHYAISTGFMALGMMFSGMISGYLQELLGYQMFFMWVLICTLPALIAIKKLPLDPHFGNR